MKKNGIMWFLSLFLSFQMIFGFTLSVFAADINSPLFRVGANTNNPGGDDDNDIFIGAPELTLVNGPVFDVKPGKKNEVNIVIKNISSYTAKSIIILPVLSSLENNPLKLDFKNDTNKAAAIAPRGETTVSFVVEVDETAASGTYEVTLNYTYFNTKGEKSQSSNKVYFKVTNNLATPNFVLENYKLSPENLNPGGSGAVSAVIRNAGPLDMYDVLITLDGLESGSLAVNGINSKNFKRVDAGTQQNFGFDIVADGSIASGNYPLTFTVKYKDFNGKSFDFSQKFFVNVGGTGAGKPSLEIRNMKEPSGIYGVNQNFNVAFDLVNIGENNASNIKITATPTGEGSVVPKSTSVQTVKALAKGASTSLSFAFAATANSKSQNYAIEFLVEYEDGTKKEGVNNVTSFKQYAGANVSNPEGDKKEGEEEKTSKPKIIVSKYVCDPMIVMAGSEFDLTMTFMNTHTEKAAKNIKMFLTMAEEKAADTEKTGNIFTPVDSSNTFYFDSIAVKGTADKKMRLYVIPDAQPKTYTLTVNFEYEDAEGNEYTATELLGINVKQPAQLDTGEIFLPESSDISMPLSVSFELYNTGKVTLNNLMITLEGDVVTQTKNTYLGNFTSGYSEFYEGSFTLAKEGENNVGIVISYDDPSGEHIENRHDFVVMGAAPMPMENQDGMNMEPEGGSSLKNVTKPVLIGLSVVVILAIILTVLYKKRKEKKEADFLAADDEDDGKGNGVNGKL